MERVSMGTKKSKDGVRFGEDNTRAGRVFYREFRLTGLTSNTADGTRHVVTLQCFHWERWGEDAG